MQPERNCDDIIHAGRNRRQIIAATTEQKNITKLVVATSLGNALEWYDIAVYGYFAVYRVESVLPEQRPDDVVAADFRHVRTVVS